MVKSMANEVRINCKNGATFVAQRYEEVFCGKPQYNYYVLIKDESLEFGIKCIHPPASLSAEQISMSVEEYKTKGRHEWFNYVHLSHYAKAREMLDA